MATQNIQAAPSEKTDIAPISLLDRRHPLWLAGFRPFFSLAILYSAALPLIWILLLSGKITIASSLPLVQWHAHEMIFGFGGAVLIGFLLTASKNWVKIRGIHERPLMVLCFLWLSERIIVNLVNVPSPLLNHLLLSLFIASAVGYILFDLIKHRKSDSFADNYFFYLLLPLIVVAKNFFVAKDFYQHGSSMGLGLLKLAFAVMFERTITQFMQNTEGVSLKRIPLLDLSIKFTVLVSAFYSFYPTQVATVVLALAGSLLLLRWFLWQPQLGFKQFGNATMYIGYFGLALHFFMEAANLLGHPIGFATASLHTFTLICMGIVIPSMMIRIAQGHTGRKPVFGLWDKIAISCILVAAFFRLIAPVLAMEQYLLWLSLSAISWTCCYVILAFRLIPYLMKPRIDGRAH